MDDLGSLVGSLMVSLLKARRMADEETAKLAELYKDNPLLEGLSVPRIRIPELSIDMPVLIEGSDAGEDAKSADKKKIIEATLNEIDSTASRENISLNNKFNTSFKTSMSKYLSEVEKKEGPVLRESISRAADLAFIDAQKIARIELSDQDKRSLAQNIRKTAYKASIIKESTPPSIRANIQTAQVKELASKENVVRLKVTFREEGLEWAVSASESGGVSQTLQPE